MWDERREQLEQAVIKAALDLFEHMGSAGAFMLPLTDGKSADLVVASGPKATVISMLESNR